MTAFTPADLEQLKERGISAETVDAQLERFSTGFPYLKIDSPSSTDNGILVVDDELAEDAEERWKEFLGAGSILAMPMSWITRRCAGVRGSLAHVQGHVCLCQRRR